jgi:DNA invertase Pin-like site-specific DNA recombinase
MRSAVKFVNYLRVSTVRQGESGLGLDAQKTAVEAFVASRQGSIIAEFVEVETGKGADALAKRPQLKAALDLCRKTGAQLVIAKLDRLARNVAFIAGLIESGVDFVAADMPQANKVMLQMHAVMSEWERDQISARTKVALAAAKAKGVKLGTAGAANLRPNIEARQAAADAFAGKLQSVLEGFKNQGFSQRKQVQELNSLGVKTAKGGTWSLMQLQRVSARLAPAAASTAA